MGGTPIDALGWALRPPLVSELPWEDDTKSRVRQGDGWCAMERKALRGQSHRVGEMPVEGRPCMPMEGSPSMGRGVRLR